MCLNQLLNDWQQGISAMHRSAPKAIFCLSFLLLYYRVNKIFLWLTLAHFLYFYKFFMSRMRWIFFYFQEKYRFNIRGKNEIFEKLLLLIQVTYEKWESLLGNYNVLHTITKYVCNLNTSYDNCIILCTSYLLSTLLTCMWTEWKWFKN